MPTTSSSSSRVDPLPPLYHAAQSRTEAEAAEGSVNRAFKDVCKRRDTLQSQIHLVSGQLGQARVREQRGLLRESPQRLAAALDTLAEPLEELRTQRAEANAAMRAAQLTHQTVCQPATTALRLVWRAARTDTDLLTEELEARAAQAFATLEDLVGPDEAAQLRQSAERPHPN